MILSRSLARLKRALFVTVPPIEHREPTMPHLSVLRDGVISAPYHVEVIACEHCNIRCSQCNHGSPNMARWFADPLAVRRDLGVLAPFLRAPFIKILGGEPLLHKDLVGLLTAVRESGIAPRLRVVTNGMLLGRMPEAAWPLIDEIEVSMYPGYAPSAELLAMARQRVSLVMETVHETFTDTFAMLGTDDQALVRRVYGACKIANLWSCMSVRDGFLYKCPHSIYLSQKFGISEDRIALDGAPDLRERVFEFLTRPQPLQSCSRCAGSAGRRHPHRQAANTLAWAQETDKTLEEIVDLQSLAAIDATHGIRTESALSGI